MIIKKKANKFEFSEKSNLIISRKERGRESSLIKSIQYCLGSNLKAFPKGWDYKKIMFLQLEIVIDKNKILIQRYNNIITVLDDGKIKKFGYLKDYSDWFQDKMEMNLKLVSKNKNTSSLASLEAILSPLYIDQDTNHGMEFYIRTHLRV